MTGAKGRDRLGAGAAELLLGRGLLLGAPLFQRLLRLLLGALLGLRRTFHAPSLPRPAVDRALALSGVSTEDAFAAANAPQTHPHPRPRGRSRRPRSAGRTDRG